MSDPTDYQVDAAVAIMNDPQYEYAAVAMREVLRRFGGGSGGHAVESQKHLDDVEAYENDAHSYRFNDEDGRAIQALAHAGLSAQQAKVHATLALVEQQRIANLIALHRHEVEYDLNLNGSRLYAGGTDQLHPGIAKALGL